MTYDVFIALPRRPGDEAALRVHLDRLADEAGLAGGAGRITLSAPGATPSVAEAGLALELVTGRPGPDVLARAVRLAARARRHLLVLLGPVVPCSAAVARLVAGFDQDPMLGTTQPRFADPATDRIWPIPGDDDRGLAAATIPRGALLHLPPDVITPELPACVLVLRWELLIAVEAAEAPGSTLAGGLLQLLAAGRRTGFRNLVDNRVVVAAPHPYADVYPPAPPADLDRLRARDPDAAGSARALADLPQRRAESLFAAAQPDDRGRLPLLLDCRGMDASHNGTTVGILGLLGGFAALAADWDIHVLAAADAANHHGLVRRYPGFRHHTETPHGTYAAAVRLSQPWDIRHAAALHDHALITAFLMLDAIAWDIAPGRADLEAAWHFVARHADGLFYISQFTRDRFRRRFPVAPGVAEAVTRFSLAAEDHADPRVPAEPSSSDILVFGNGYDHKHVRPTARLLSDAFPFHRITVLGVDDAPGQNVTSRASGALARSTLVGLVAGARVIVYPSVYEGFGLPAVEGLAHGRTVLVRRSRLWTEIAAHSRLPGRLCEFDDPASLVEGVGRALAGLPVEPLPSGTALADGAAPPDWIDCARRILALLGERLATPGLDHWWAREHALRGLRQS